MRLHLAAARARLEHREFVERLAARLDGMRSGPPDDEATETGAIVHRGQYEKVLEYLGIGRDEGARVLAGGSAAPTATRPVHPSHPVRRGRP